MISTVDDRPFGSVYVAVSPTFLPLIALPRGDLGEYTSIGEPLSSREASRKVTSASSPSNRTVTVMPGPTTPSVRGGSPTLECVRMWVSWWIRASCLPCSSLAAWYPPFSRRSPSSRAASIFLAMSILPWPERWSSSALSRSYASWVSQVTVSSRVSVTSTPRIRRTETNSAGPGRAPSVGVIHRDYFVHLSQFNHLQVRPATRTCYRI